MKTITILAAIVAMGVIIYMITFKKKTISKMMELNHFPETRESYNGTLPQLTTEDWRMKFKGAGLEHRWERFKSLLRNEIVIASEEADESAIGIGQSKIGGLPDLPKNQTWFQEHSGKPLSFLAQINLSETKQFDISNQLPESGLIYFFYSAEQEVWGFDPNDEDKFKVFYFDGNISDLRRTEFPTNMPSYARYKTCKLSFANSVSAPDLENKLLSKILSDKEQDAYMELAAYDEVSKLLGYSNNIQGAMEEECQLVTNKIYCGDPSGYENPRAEELMKDADKWVLLFQIDSIDKADMMWGDAGRIYFWIKKEHLERREFDKSWFILQCS